MKIFAGALLFVGLMVECCSAADTISGPKQTNAPPWSIVFANPGSSLRRTNLVRRAAAPQHEITRQLREIHRLEAKWETKPAFADTYRVSLSDHRD